MDALQPFSAAEMELLWPRLEAETPIYVQATTAIEGNSFTLGETTVFLSDGVTIGGKRLKEHLEIVNAARAHELMLTMAKAHEPVTLQRLFDLHAAVVAHEPYAGALRDHRVAIRGSMHVPPEPAAVAARIDDVFARYERNLQHAHPVVAGATLHFDLLTIHPFTEGNGRTARLVHNLHLRAHGYPPINIDPTDDKAAYSAALSRAQMQGQPGYGDPVEFVDYMTSLERRALAYYRAGLETVTLHRSEP